MKYLKPIRYWILPIFIPTFLILLWEFAMPDSIAFFFSKPTKIFQAIRQSFSSGQAATDSITTFLATLKGLFFGLVLGLIITIPSYFSHTFKRTLIFLFAGLASFPILAVAPMFMIWFGTGMPLKTSIAATMAGIVVVNAALNFESAIPKNLLDQIVANGLVKSKIALGIIMPYGIRELIRAVPNACNSAFLGAFIGEFIASSDGIGYRILRSGSLYQVDYVLAYSLLAVMILLIIQATVHLISSQVVALTDYLSVHKFLRLKSRVSYPWRKSLFNT